MRTILVPLAQGLSGEPALDAALALAKRLNSHVRAMFVRPDPDIAMLSVPEPFLAPGVTREAIESEGRKAAAEEKARFDSWQARHGVPGMPPEHRLDSCFASWWDKAGELETVLTRFGRVSDLVVLSRANPNKLQAERCFDAAVFGTGRPTLLVPGMTLPWDPTDHIMIAWNGSLEASHAVFGAMSLLLRAGRVSLFHTPAHEGEPEVADDLAEALSWYGVRVHRIAAKHSSSPGEALVAAAKSQQATLIVMGAYTHSRLRQSFLGGVTTHVLAHTEIPVVMSH